MSTCAYAGCKKIFESKRKDRLFCSPTCKTKDNILKRQMIPLTLCKLFARLNYVLRFDDSEIICTSVDTNWLLSFLENNNYVWSKSEWIFLNRETISNVS